MIKKGFAFLSCFIFVSNINAQSIVGKWNGIIKVMGNEMNLAFNIAKTDTGFKSTMDSPDQKAFGIPCSFTSFENKKIIIKIEAGKIEYAGTLQNNTIDGIFTQGAFTAPLQLTTNVITSTKKTKPQEPLPPFSYYSEDVFFTNQKDSVTLAGTLTLPAKGQKCPIVILVTGSGPQNRNEEIMGHKPFLLLADQFAKNGIGTLRYDDRGVAKSKGKFATATSFDFANDAEAAVSYLTKRVETDVIGIAGHSEGGLIAPMVAERNKNVYFVIMLAGPGVRGDKILLEQNYLIAKASGATKTELENSRKINQKIYNIVLQTKDNKLLQEKLKPILTEEVNKIADKDLPENTTKQQLIVAQLYQISNPWMQNFISYDPIPTLRKIKCPVLAINGSLDLQVPSQLNLNSIQKNITSNGNKSITIKEYKNLNHLFQTAITGNTDEYATNEETFNQKVIDDIVNWIKKLK